MPRIPVDAGSAIGTGSFGHRVIGDLRSLGIDIGGTDQQRIDWHDSLAEWTSRGERLFALLPEGRVDQVTNARQTGHLVSPANTSQDYYDRALSNGETPPADQDNLMTPTGGEHLFPWQVALMRASRHIEDSMPGR